MGKASEECRGDHTAVQHRGKSTHAHTHFSHAMARLLRNLTLAAGSLLVAPWDSHCSCSESASSPPAFVNIQTATPFVIERTTSTSANPPPLPPPRNLPIGLAAWSHQRQTAPRLAAAGGGNTDERVGRGDGERGLPASSTSTDVSTSISVLEDDESVISQSESNNNSSRVQKKSPNLRAYWDILRPHNIPSSFGLVATGALVASHGVGALLDRKVRHG